MTRRALLLGLPDYDADNLKVPAAENDVRDLSLALKSAGFPDAAVELQTSNLTTSRMRSRIWRFLDEARAGDHLFVYFSGHGVVRDGHRHLVPGDFDPSAPDSEMLSDLAVYAKARSSKAASVVFVIDACREGVELVLAPVTGAKGAMAIADTGLPETPTIAIVHSCEDGQQSFFDRGVSGRSHFTEVLCHVLQQENGPSTLGEVLEVVRAHFRDRGARQAPTLGEHCHGRAGPPNQILVKEDVTEQLRQRIADSVWCGALRDLALFERLNECPGIQRQIEVIVLRAEEVIQQGSAALPQNRWRPQDPAKRVLSKLDALWTNRQAAQSLSVPEAALILVTPHIYEAVLALAELHLAQHGSPLAPDCGSTTGERPVSYMWRAWRSAFMGDHRWARRRELVQQRDVLYTLDLAAWQLQRFLHRSGELWHFERGATDRRSWLGDSLSDLLKPAPFKEVQWDSRVGMVMQPDRLMRLARLLYCSYEDVEVAYDERSAFVPPRVHVGEGRQQWDVNERKAAHLLSLLGRMALDPRRLPEAPAEHIGIDGEMHAHAIVESLQIVEWHRTVDGSLSLAHTCFHQAFDHALGAEAKEVDKHLRSLHDHASGRDPWAAELPQRADARELKPEVRDGHQAYQRPHLHFQLDPERIRELLMGPKLYGDARYAVREAYQNAVDACRYRRAREEYLVRVKRGEKGAWVPRVTIRTGTDDQGRPFIECEDNGIGMERRHLDGLFAFAGRRFADSHEFHLEKAQWDEAKIPFWSNSRFGIGVLAYFMLADEVMVWTRRVSDLYSHPTERCLTARILSGSDLFRVGEDLSACRVGGTRIRLYLDGRPDDLRGAQLLEHVVTWLVLPEIEVELVDGERIVHRFPAGQAALTRPAKAPDVQRGQSGTVPRVTFGVGRLDELGQHRVFCTISPTFSKLPPRAEWEFLPLADGIKVGDSGLNYPESHSDLTSLSAVPPFMNPRRPPGGDDLALTLIVNLKGDHAPTLSVDRNRLLAWDEGREWALSEIRTSLFSSAAACREITAAHFGVLASCFPFEAHRFNCELFAAAGDSKLIPLAEGRPEVLSLTAVGIHPVDAALTWITSGDQSSTVFIQTSGGGILNVIRGRLAVLGRAGVSLPGAFEHLAAHDATLDSVLRRGRETVHVLPLLWRKVSPGRFHSPRGQEQWRTWEHDSAFVQRVPGVSPSWSVGEMLHLAATWEIPLGEVVKIAHPLTECGVQVAELPSGAGAIIPRRRAVELLSPDLDGSGPYSTSVSRSQLIRAAAKWEIPLGEVVEIARPLVECGVEVADLPPRAGPIIPSRRAVDLLSVDVDGIAPYTTSVATAQLIRAAAKWEIPLGEVMEIARPLAECGVQVAEMPPGAGAIIPSRRAVELVSADLDGSGLYTASVLRSQLFRVAAKWEIPFGEAVEIVRPLAECGVEVPDLPPGASPIIPTRRAVELLSRDLDGIAPYTTSVATAQLISAAAKWEIPLGEVVEIARPLAECGVEVARLAPEASSIVPNKQAVELLSWDGLYTTSVPATHLLRAAARWEIPLAEVVEIARPLAECGVEVAELPYGASALLTSNRIVELLSEDLESLAPITMTVPASHLVLAAAKWEIPLGEVVEIARALAEFGAEVAELPPGAHLINPSKRAAELLSRDLDRSPPYITTLGATHLVQAAAKWEISLGEVMEIAMPLAACGIAVAELNPASVALRPRPWVGDVRLVPGAVLSPLTVAATAENLRLDPLDLWPDIQALAAAEIDVSESVSFLEFLKHSRESGG